MVVFAESLTRDYPASYHEVSCWIGDVAVVASSLLLPVNTGGMAASFLGPEIVPVERSEYKPDIRG